MIFHPDPHFEEEMHTETGGTWLLVQHPGPTTSKAPITPAASAWQRASP